ncbi:hypothetical protein NKI59_22610 [Mesorhizobium sp. M0598]|uniref:hypothetical protein n=1 Tax=Mesorhizobium sp. M0598 TaxID=2956968 RepID=UPI003336ADF4
MVAAFGALGLDLDRNGSVWRKSGGRSFEGRNRIGVAIARFGGVIRPLKALDRLFVRRVLRASRKPGIGLGEAFHRLEEVGLILIVIPSMERKSHQVVALVLREIETERHHVGPGDGIDFQTAA